MDSSFDINRLDLEQGFKVQTPVPVLSKTLEDIPSSRTSPQVRTESIP